MKKLLMMALAALMFTGVAVAEENAGVKFTEDTFANVQKVAKKAKKPIFVDIYTTWCGPCKYLASKIFPALRSYSLIIKSTAFCVAARNCAIL